MASKRLRHVLKVFSSVGLLSYREKHLPQDQQTTPVKLRQAFEQLGPSFVKIGQILSTPFARKLYQRIIKAPELSSSLE